MGRPFKFSPEMQERAVRLLEKSRGEHESQWAAIRSVAAKMGCTTESLRRWVRRAEATKASAPALVVRATILDRVRIALRELVASDGVGWAISGVWLAPGRRGSVAVYIEPLPREGSVTIWGGLWGGG